MGALHSQCRLTPEPPANGPWKIDITQEYLCGANRQCNPGTYCGSLKVDEPGWASTLSYDNDVISTQSFIFYGLFDFDNVGSGLLQIFRCITFEGWTNVMYYYDDYIGVSSTIYFNFLTFIGGFFLLNLFLAVIMTTYEEMLDI